MSATSVGEIGLDLVVNKNGFEKQMSGIQSLAKKVGATLAGAFAVKKIVDFGKSCIELGSDLSEMENVTNTVFGNMAAKVDEFAKAAANTAGQTETQAKNYVGTLGAMAKAFGFTTSQAYDMSTTLSQLAGDVSSFYNISQDEAFSKMKSVFTGETEALKSLGVVMTQTALDEYALANGYGKTVSNMSEAEKVALRYAFVQEKLSAASGDFLRTQDSWANQMKRLKLNINNIMTSIGQGLINVLLPAIKVINTILSKMATLASAFKAFTELLTGKKASGGSGIGNAAAATADLNDGLSDASASADNLADSTSGVGKAAKKAAKEMRSLMGFDRINKVSEPTTDTDSDTSSGTGGGGVGSAVDFGSLAKGETVIEETEKKMSSLVKKAKELGALFKKGFKISFPNAKKVVNAIKADLTNAGKSVKDIFTDPKVANAMSNWLNSEMLKIGAMSGMFSNVGLTIASNIIGGFADYISDSSDYIKDRIAGIFNAKEELYNLQQEAYTAISNIFSVFRGDSARGCTSAIIGIFADAYLGWKELTAKWDADIASLWMQPLIDNQEKIKTAFEGTLGRIQIVLDTLWASVQNTVQKALEVYDAHIHPMFESLSEGISNITGAVLDAWQTYISPVLDYLADKFSTVWEEHVQPVINTALEVIGKISDLITALWENVIQPLVIEFIETSAPVLGDAIKNIGDLVLDLLGTVSDVADGILTALGGVIDFFTGVFSGDWDKATQGLQAISEGLQKAIDAVFGFIEDKILKPFDDFLSGVFEKDWTESFGVFGIILNNFFANVKKIWDKIKGIFDGIINFVKDVFSGDWDSAWQDIVNVFQTVFGGLEDIAKAPINGVIGLINGMLSALESGLNWVVSKVNALSFDVPNWVPGIGGKRFGFDLPEVAFGRIPYLADGGFVKKNTPQLAMIGDNRHQGEVVAPEDKLREMAMEAVKAVGISGLTREDLELVINQAVARIISALYQMGFYIDSETIAKATQKGNRSTMYQFNKVDLS